MKLTRYACLFLALCLAFSMCACGGNNTPPAGEHTTHTGGSATCTAQAVCAECGESYGDLAAHRYENGSCAVCGAAEESTPGGENPPIGEDPPAVETPTLLTGLSGIPADVKGAYAPIALGELGGGDYVANAEGFTGGAKLNEEAFPYLGRSVEGEEEITAKQLLNYLRSDCLTNKLYRVVEADGPVVIDGATNRTYIGHGAVILSPVPLLVKNSTGITFENITMINVAGGAAITFENTSTVTLRGVETVGGITLDAGTAALTVAGCRILSTGDGLALAQAESATVYDSVLVAEGTALSAGGADVFIENCLINSPAGGVVLAADDSRIWYSTLRGTVKGSATNLLVAENHIYGTPVSVELKQAKNSVVLLNRLMGVTVEESHSIFVAENHLSYHLVSQKNDYILGNGNTFAAGVGAYVKETTNQSGDSLTDVNARLAVGANEDLLPKVDKENFVGMARKTTVRERDPESNRSVVKYLEGESESGKRTVILAPGAYTQGPRIFLDTSVPDVTIYGYGVLLERESASDCFFNLYKTTRLTVKGFAVGHTFNSSGNTIVVSKNAADNTIQLIAGAGMIKDWTDSKYYSFSGLSGGFYGYRPGHNEPYADMSFQKILSYNEATGIINMQLSASTFNMIEVGDSITCRGGAQGAVAVQVSNSDSPVMEDITIYGSGGFAFNDGGLTGAGLSLLRAWVTTAPRRIISEEEYNRYRALEEQYGVDFGVLIDELGRFRSSPHRMSSIDATHSSKNEQGMQAVSCLFETMCDDGTNQCSGHGRMAGWEDLGDGTIKLIYKSHVSAVSYGLGNTGYGNSNCHAFSEGELVYMYTTKGRLVCADTPALSVTKTEGKQKNSFDAEETFYSVVIDKAAVDFTALEDIDLNGSSPYEQYVAVDNHSRSSNGFLFDNCLIRDMRSRCLLLQASNGVVKNCTLTGSGMAAVLLWHDVSWGESGMSSNVKVLNNYMENNGHYGDNIKNTPIYVMGLTRTVDEKTMIQRGFEIIGNKVENRATPYALAVEGAADLLIKDNDFGLRRNDPADADASIRLNVVRRVVIEGNTYSPNCPEVSQFLSAFMYDEVSGADVTELAPDLMLSAGADSFQLNLPTYDGQNRVSHHGNWQVGFVKRTTGTGFSPYTTFIKEGWICNTLNHLWGGRREGGLWMTNGYAYSSSPDNNVVIGFTAPESGYYRVLCGSFLAPSGDGAYDGLYAMAVDGQIVWPANGTGDYNDESNYYRITTSTTMQEIEQALQGFEVYLEKGQMLQFTHRMLEKWCKFTMLPVVLRVEKD